MLQAGSTRSTTKGNCRALSKADQRELARQLGAIIELVYDGTLDARGPAGTGVVRRLEGAKAILDATLEPVQPRGKTGQRR